MRRRPLRARDRQPGQERRAQRSAPAEGQRESLLSLTFDRLLPVQPALRPDATLAARAAASSADRSPSSLGAFTHPARCHRALAARLLAFARHCAGRAAVHTGSRLVRFKGPRSFVRSTIRALCSRWQARPPPCQRGRRATVLAVRASDPARPGIRRARARRRPGRSPGCLASRRAELVEATGSRQRS